MLRHWFANPWAFWILGLTPLLGLLGALALRRRRQALGRLGNLPALQLLVPSGRWARLLRGLVGSLAVTLLVVGIAGPQWGRDWGQPAAPGRDLVVVLDLSRSMFAEQPSRLHRAREALVDLAQALKERGGHRVGLVVFAAHAKMACPLTHDYDHFREAVESLDADHLPREILTADDDPSGTRIGAGLRAAVDLHEPRFAGYQDILLLSDGDDPAGDGGDWRLPAAEARAQGIPVHTVGIGDPAAPGSKVPGPDGKPLLDDDKEVRSRLQEAPLREIADITGGTYTAAQTRALPLGRLFRERIEPGPAREEGDDTLPLYRQRYAWFLGAALVLLALETVLVMAPKRPRAAPAPAGGEAVP